MLRYTLKRLVNAFVILFIIASVSWLLMQFLPGSPFNDDKLTDEAKAQLEAKYGLDDPLLVQYARYMGNLARGTSETPMPTMARPWSTSSWARGWRYPPSWGRRRS